MNNFLQVLKNLGPARLVTMAVLVLGLLGFFIFIISRLSEPGYKLLYSDLDLGESAQIVEKLEAQGVAYNLGQGGSQIFVPGDQVNRLRLSLASEGLPSSGSIGNEVFDSGEALGTSAFMQQVNKLRAMEGELGRTISSLEGVKSARVHLVLPERELFSREKREPSASIVLKMQGLNRLDKSQVAAIQHLVAGAVPELAPQQISIVDDRGTLLARGTRDAEGGQALLNDAAERQIAYENRLMSQIEEILGRAIGAGRVRVSVNAQINFDRVRKNIETFDPDSQVVRSSQVISEELNAEDREADEAVSVQTNLPEIIEEPIAGGARGAGSFSTQNRTEETTNYEISKIVREEISETGQVQKVSVAVLVDGTYITNEEGQRVYQPRSEQELERLEALVKSAIGFDEKRGDIVEVVNLQFADTNLEEEVVEPKVFGIAESTFSNMVETMIIGLVGILAMLLIVRPLLMRLFESRPSDLSGVFPDKDQQYLGGSYAGSGQAALAGPGMASLAPPPPGVDPAAYMEQQRQMMAAKAAQDAELALAEQQSELEEMINIQQFEGKIKASSLKRVGDIIEKNPEQSANVLRNWMYEQDDK